VGTPPIEALSRNCAEESGIGRAMSVSNCVVTNSDIKMAVDYRGVVVNLPVARCVVIV
jgi:hypothetical protein